MYLSNLKITKENIESLKVPIFSSNRNGNKINFYCHMYTCIVWIYSLKLGFYDHDILVVYFHLGLQDVQITILDNYLLKISLVIISNNLPWRENKMHEIQGHLEMPKTKFGFQNEHFWQIFKWHPTLWWYKF